MGGTVERTTLNVFPMFAMVFFASKCIPWLYWTDICWWKNFQMLDPVGWELGVPASRGEVYTSVPIRPTKKGGEGKTWDTMLPTGMIAQDDRPLSSVVALSLTMLPKWDGCPRWSSEDMGWGKMTPSPTTLLLLILGKGALIIISAVVGISFNYHESGHSDTSPVGGVWIIDVAPN